MSEKIVTGIKKKKTCPSAAAIAADSFLTFAVLLKRIVKTKNAIFDYMRTKYLRLHDD
jgi:hypothetical protein